MTKRTFICIIGLALTFISWNLDLNLKTIPLINYKYTKAFDSRSGENVLLKNVFSDKLNVIIFHSLDCPYNKTYHDKLNTLIQKSDSINFIFINSNPSEIEEYYSRDHVPSFILSNDNSYYLLDKTRDMKRIFDVKKNGTCIICRSYENNQSLNLYYRGPVDNSPQSNLSENVLEFAISDALKKEETEYKGFQTGCRILNH